MYDPRTGNVYCDWCRALLGNINGEGNYYALIRLKYCPECRTFARSESNRAAQRAYRQRKRQEKKQLATKLELLEEENRLLRERVKELRRNEL